MCVRMNYNNDLCQIMTVGVIFSNPSIYLMKMMARLSKSLVPFRHTGRLLLWHIF